MTPTLVVWLLGFFPALALGWAGGTYIERNKRVTESPKRDLLSRENIAVSLTVAALVIAIVASLFAYDGKTGGEDRDERNFACLANYVETGQKNSAPATIANREQSAAWRDYQQGYSVEDDAKNLNREQLKARWLTLYKVYEEVQTPPLPDLREFCEEN